MDSGMAAMGTRNGNGAASGDEQRAYRLSAAQGTCDSGWWGSWLQQEHRGEAGGLARMQRRRAWARRSVLVLWSFKEAARMRQGNALAVAMADVDAGVGEDGGTREKHGSKALAAVAGHDWHGRAAAQQGGRMSTGGSLVAVRQSLIAACSWLAGERHTEELRRAAGGGSGGCTATQEAAGGGACRDERSRGSHGRSFG